MKNAEIKKFIFRFVAIIILVNNQVIADPYKINLDKNNRAPIGMSIPRYLSKEIKFEIEDVEKLFIYGWKNESYASFNVDTRTLTLKDNTPGYIELICVYYFEETYKECGFLFITLT